MTSAFWLATQDPEEDDMTDEFTPQTGEAPPSDADTYEVPDDKAAEPGDETPVLDETEDSENDVEPDVDLEDGGA